MTWKQKIIGCIVLGLILSAALNIIMIRKNGTLKSDYLRQLNNVTALTTPSRTDTIRDSIRVTTQGVISGTVRELTKQQLLDQQLIKDLKLRIKDISSVGTIATEDQDTVYLTRKDSVEFSFKDAWTEINMRLSMDTIRCNYSVRDSLETVISTVYRHHFLWWRWGKQGYQVHIVNYNPHSSISYSRYINIE